MAIKNEREDLEYEIDENGRRVLVRSISATEPVYLRFTNKTNRPVLIWWRSYQGQRRIYNRIDPGGCFDVSSYITHPWGFSDAVTKERFVIMNKKIFRPPRGIANDKERTNWNITIGLRSLRVATVFAVASMLKDPRSVDEIDLPRTVADDLKWAVVMVNRRLPPLPQLDAQERPTQLQD